MNLAETRYLANLINGIRAIMLVSEHDTKVRKVITDKATAVKLFATAGFRREALPVLEEIRSAFDTDPRKPMVDKLIDEVIRHWRFQNLVPRAGE